MTDPIWYEEARTAALNVLTNGEPTSGEIVDAMMPFFAKAFHEGRVAENKAFHEDPRGLWYQPVNPYLPVAAPSDRPTP